MRVPAVLGFVIALLVGVVAVGVFVSSIGDKPPIVATLQPTITPVAITTLPPTPTPVQTAIASSPSPTAKPGPSESSIGTDIGQLAPPFEIPSLGGGTVGTAASATTGKPLWVNFMATWCPQCQDELPMMASIKLEVGESMDMLLVDVGEDQPTVSAFMTRLGITLPTGLDESATVQEQWGAFALPVHYFLDANGVVQDVVYGGAPRSVFQDAVRTIVPEASFSPQP